MKRASFKRLFILEFTSCSLIGNVQVLQPHQESICVPVSETLGEVPKINAGQQDRVGRAVQGKTLIFRTQTSHVLGSSDSGPHAGRMHKWP